MYVYIGLYENEETKEGHLLDASHGQSIGNRGWYLWKKESSSSKTRKGKKIKI